MLPSDKNNNYYFVFRSVFLTAYTDMVDRNEVRQSAWQMPGWDECVRKTGNHITMSLPPSSSFSFFYSFFLSVSFVILYCICAHNHLCFYFQYQSESFPSKFYRTQLLSFLSPPYKAYGDTDTSPHRLLPSPVATPIYTMKRLCCTVQFMRLDNIIIN